MKKLISLLVIAFVAVIASSATATEQPADQDVGSCYSVKPICIGSSPLCVCDNVRNCYWVCAR